MDIHSGEGSKPIRFARYSDIQLHFGGKETAAKKGLWKRAKLLREISGLLFTCVHSSYIRTCRDHPLALAEGMCLIEMTSILSQEKGVCSPAETMQEGSKYSQNRHER
jgi:hypothetical protein